MSGSWNIRRTFWGDPFAYKENDKEDVLNDWKFRISYGYTGNMLDGQTPDLLLKLGTLTRITAKTFPTFLRSPTQN